MRIIRKEIAVGSDIVYEPYKSCVYSVVITERWVTTLL